MLILSLRRRKRALVVAFKHRFQNCSRFPICPLRVLVFEIEANTYNLFECNAFCLKPDETGFMFDCSMQCSIMFDYLRVRFPNVQLCSISKILE